MNRACRYTLIDLQSERERERERDVDTKVRDKGMRPVPPNGQSHEKSGSETSYAPSTSRVPNCIRERLCSIVIVNK